MVTGFEAVAVLVGSCHKPAFGLLWSTNLVNAGMNFMPHYGEKIRALSISPYILGNWGWGTNLERVGKVVTATLAVRKTAALL